MDNTIPVLLQLETSDSKTLLLQLCKRAERVISILSNALTKVLNLSNGQQDEFVSVWIDSVTYWYEKSNDWYSVAMEYFKIKKIKMDKYTRKYEFKIWERNENKKWRDKDVIRKIITKSDKPALPFCTMFNVILQQDV